MKSLLFFLLVLLSGCKTSIQSNLEVAGLAFYNNTDFEIYKVSLKVKATGGMVACTLVEPKSYCGTGFPIKHYQASELIVTWDNHTGKTQSHALILAYPDNFKENTGYVAVIKFEKNGRFEGFFREKKPVI